MTAHPSPANARKTMKRAVVKNEATKLRNELAKAKQARGMTIARSSCCHCTGNSPPMASRCSWTFIGSKRRTGHSKASMRTTIRLAESSVRDRSCSMGGVLAQNRQDRPQRDVGGRQAEHLALKRKPRQVRHNQSISIRSRHLLAARYVCRPLAAMFTAFDFSRALERC